MLDSTASRSELVTLSAPKQTRVLVAARTGNKKQKTKDKRMKVRYA
jgi:hypothetical protein